jgi:ribonuclease G
VNDQNFCREIKEYISEIAPEKEKIVKHYRGSAHIFEKFGVEKQIKGSFGKTVSFKSGAYLIIEHTEALHVIDVNSGNRSKSVNNQETNALEVNLAAVDEIARQLRLRDMGGIIVIDFIDMHLNENKNKVFERMKEIMEADRTKHSILPLSKFGLMQITRQRVRPEMDINIREKCPTCSGTGEISPSILLVERIENTLADLMNSHKIKRIILKLHPYVAAFVEKGLIKSLKRIWQKRYKCKIKIVPISSYDFLQFRFFDEQGKKIN